jgi:hypothetical protein
MSVFPSGLQLRERNYGLIVPNVAKTVPSSATGTIFTVVGRILLTSLVGQVSTAIVGTPTLSVGVTPTGGASAPTALCTATSISGAAVGTILCLPKLQASALIVSASGVGSTMGNPLDTGGLCLVSAGAITITTSAAATGAITWSLQYMPWDATAVVTAA